MEKLTGRDIKNYLETLTEEELDYYVYAWGCQECSHGVTAAKIATDEDCILLETDV